MSRRLKRHCALKKIVFRVSEEQPCPPDVETGVASCLKTRDATDGGMVEGPRYDARREYH